MPTYEFKAGDEVVFNGDGAIRSGAGRTIAVPGVDEVDLDPYPHALRHTGATRLAMGGASRRVLMEIGGWRTGEMLDEVYEHTTDAQMAAALEGEVSPVTRERPAGNEPGSGHVE